MPIGMYRNYKGLPNAQQRAEGRTFLKKKAADFVMSKPVGKVLNSKVGRAGVKVGNTVKKVASAPFKWAGKQIEKEMRMNKAKDDMYKIEGKKLNDEYSGFKYGVQIKKKSK